MADGSQKDTRTKDLRLLAVLASRVSGSLVLPLRLVWTHTVLIIAVVGSQKNTRQN